MYKHFAYCILIGFLVTISTAAESAKPLAGRVVDENDQPLAGARVVAMGSKEGCDSLQELASTTTDSDGRFSFDGQLRDKCVVILAGKDGKCLDWAYPVLVHNADLSLRLGPVAAIEGAIVDEVGKPIAGAAVDASLKRQTPYISRSLPDGILNTKTDAQGHFRFGNLPSEVKVGFDITATGYARALYVGVHAEGPFSPGQKGLRFVLPPEGRLEGAVVEIGVGKPLADVWVQAHGSVTSGQYWAKAKTDKDGRFWIAGLSGGKYDIEIVGPDYATLPEWLGSQEKVQVETGKTTSAVKIEATKGGTLEIVLTDAATGKPIVTRGTMNISPAEDLRIRKLGFMRNDGVARLCLCPGRYIVNEVDGIGCSYQREKDKTLLVEAGKTHRAAVAVTVVQRLTCIVRDFTGKPIPAARIQILSMFGTSKNIVAGDDGQFSLEPADVEPLCCFLSVRHPQKNLVALDGAAKGEKAPDITLFPPAKVSGVVRDAQHRPVIGANVQVQIDASHMGRFGIVATAQTDKEGRYQLDLAGETSTSYVISARAPSYGVAEMLVGSRELHEGERETKEWNLLGLAKLRFPDAGRVKLKDLVVMAADRVVHGVVKDQQGKPVPGAVVTAKRTNGPAFPDSVVSDEKGQFTLEHLDNSDGIYLFAKVPGRGWIEEMSTIAPGQTEVTIKVGPSHWD